MADPVKFTIDGRELEAAPGTLVIAMSEGDFNPFSAFPHPGRPVVTVISRYKGTLEQPDVARNVIAHELGHAIGLKHNDDPTALMCGWPNRCPGNFDLFSRRSFIGPTSSERAYLMGLYPATWTPKCWSACGLAIRGSTSRIASGQRSTWRKNHRRAR